MSARSEVLLWAQRIIKKGGNAEAHQLLEIRANAGPEAATEAFHKVARTAHPDLHRTTLSAEEFAMVNTAYARVAGAYQELRTSRMQTTKMKPLTGDASGPGIPVRPATAGVSVPSAPAPVPTAAGAAQAMNGKALIYYRKAELALRRGDLRGALLQLKMAIAGDPQSALLRTALTQVETELAKG